MRPSLGAFLFLATLSLLVYGPQALARNGQDSDEAAHLQITAVTYNYAQVPRQTLDRAEREASRIFHNAGVEFSWRNCQPAATDIHQDADCTQPIGSTILGMRILAGFGVVQGITNSKTLGLAVGNYASVSFRWVRQEAAIVGAMPSEILGPAMAHELGHLLLRQPGHSSRGIMRAVWSREDFERAPLGAFAFTREQAEVIRIEVERRVQSEGTLEAESIARQE